MNDQTLPQNGDIKKVDNRQCVFYEGYWIKQYKLPKQQESYAERRYLIKMLTKRVFRNTEPGINTPGNKLEETRKAYKKNKNPGEKRVLAGMLAGALLNRASDILTHVVELQKDGVEITRQNELIRQCGENLMEALELGKNVKHYSGAEGIDELWGEPFKAFSLKIDEFYNSRYQKIGLAMRMIDDLSDIIINVVNHHGGLIDLDMKIKAFTETAKHVAETAKVDPIFITLWPKFVFNAESIIEHFESDDINQNSDYSDLISLLRTGINLIKHISSARVTMPKSFAEYEIRCQDFINSQQCKVKLAY